MYDNSSGVRGLTLAGCLVLLILLILVLAGLLLFFSSQGLALLVLGVAWSAAEQRAVRNLQARGFTFSEIAEVIPGRSAQAIKSALDRWRLADKLKLHRPKNELNPAVVPLIFTYPSGKVCCRCGKTSEHVFQVNKNRKAYPLCAGCIRAGA